MKKKNTIYTAARGWKGERPVKVGIFEKRWKDKEIFVKRRSLRRERM